MTMANIVRGLRRIGWVVTVPVAALVVLVFFETTKEFSASNYQETTLRHNWDYSKGRPFFTIGRECQDLDTRQYSLQEIRNNEGAILCFYFSKEVPLDITHKVAADFIQKTRADAITNGWHHEADFAWQFTVHKQVNKLKLAELVAASIAISALVIQGLISVFAWVVRGFKG